MAVPTITTDYSSLSYWESASGTGWGANAAKWTATTDFVLEGTYSVACGPNATGDGGYGLTTASNVDLGTYRLYLWVNVVSPKFVGTVAQKGVYIRICTSSTSWTTDYRDYIVGGQDVAWVGKGWHLVALDCNRTPDDSSGSTTLSTIRRIGLGINFQATANKSDVICIDSWWYGTYIEATGVTSSSANHSFSSVGNTITGSSNFTTDGFQANDVIRISGTASNDGEYTLATVGTTTMTTNEALTTEGSVASNIDGGITLESIYTKDGPTDDEWRGIVSKNRDGDYEINGKLIIGDQSGSARTFFVCRGDSVILADQPLSTSTAGLGLFSAEDTGVTMFTIGQSVGTGDDRVGFDGSVFRQDDTFVSTKTNGSAIGIIDVSAAIDTCEMFGSTFSDINGGVQFANDTGHYTTNSTFSNCSQIDLYAVEARNMVFASYGGTDGALLWRNGVTDIENSQFLTCTRGIEHDTATAGQTYYGLQFANNTYDVHNSSSAGTVVINATKSAKGVNSNPNTYINSAGGTTTINNTKTLLVLCKNEAGNALEGIRVRIENDPAGTLISEGSTDSVGEYTDSTYNYSTDEDVKIIARLKGFKFNSAFSTITVDGLTVPFTMIRDPSVNRP